MPSVTVKLISNQDQPIGSVLLQLQHGDERAVRQALHRLFEHVCSETQIDQQLKRQPNIAELARLRLQQSITLHLAVSKRVAPLPEPALDTSSKVKDTCLIAVREGLRDLEQPIGNTTDPERYRSALRVVGARIEQQALWLQEIGLALARSPYPSNDPQTHAQSVQKLINQLDRLNDQLAEQQEDLKQQQERIGKLIGTNQTLQEDKRRLNERIAQLEGVASQESDRPAPHVIIRSAGEGRF